ncbi:MAG: hypothetical protein J6A52_04285 [Bacilli bacterium]|nr:hypothetical protein [Bacilli bacterium]
MEKIKKIAILSWTLIAIATISIFSIVQYKEFKDKEEEIRLENERIDVARESVSSAIASRTLVDVAKAKGFVNLVETESVKLELTKEIEALEIDIDKENIKNEFSNLLKSVENNLNQSELNSAISKINLIKYDDIKSELLVKANSIQEKVTAEKKRLEQLAYYNKMLKVDATPVISTPPSNVKTLETIKGKITAFTPFCEGCSGYTASGKYVGGGDIYQYDSEYGMVRIVAGDKSYPFGTIVRIKNLGYFGGDVYAMVLDRGGAIGKNKRAIFDLLFATKENAYKFGVANNIECEILRIGY